MFVICKIQDGTPVSFLASCAFRTVQTTDSPLGARQFSNESLAVSYATFWKSVEPFALIQVVSLPETQKADEIYAFG